MATFFSVGCWLGRGGAVITLNVDAYAIELLDAVVDLGTQFLGGVAVGEGLHV